MPEYLHPGVFIEETSFRGKPIEGVATSTAGFVGRARSGPDGTATLVTSFGEFRRIFGEPFSEQEALGSEFLGHAVRAFFENGGRRAYIVRVLASDALPSERTLELGTVLRLPDTVTLRGPTDTIPLNSLRHVSQGSVLRLYTRSNASAPFMATRTLTVDSYDATRKTVTVAATGALTAGETLNPAHTYFLVDGVAPHGAPPDQGPTFTARHRGQGGDSLAVDIRPRDKPPMTLTVPSTVPAQPIIGSLAGTGPSSGTNQATLPAAILARIRVGDRISFSGSTTEEVEVTAIGAAQVDVTFGPGEGNNHTGPERIFLRKRAPSPDAPSLIPLGRLPAGGLDLDGNAAGAMLTITLPHDAAAYLQDDDRVQIGEASGPISDFTIRTGGVQLTGSPITFTLPAGGGLHYNHATCDVRLVRTSEANPDILRLSVGDASFFHAPYRDPSFQRIALTDGSTTEEAQVFLANPGRSELVVDRSSITIGAGAWVRAESLELRPDGTDSLRVASTSGFYSGALAEIDPGPASGIAKEYLTVTSVDPGARTVSFATAPTFGGAGFVDVPADPSARAAFARVLEFDMDVSQGGRIKESFSGLSWNPDSSASSFSRYYASRINDPDSGSLLVSVVPPAGPLALAPTTQPITSTGFPAALENGSDGSALAAIDLIGRDNGPGQRTGIEALKERDDIAICAVPGVWDPVVQSALLTHCELMRYRIAVLDGRPGQSDVSVIEAHRNNYDSRYGAYYASWLEALDLNTGRTFAAPPSGYVAGIYARSDNERGVHKAPANEVVRNIRDVQLPFGDGEQDVLNPVGVNLIREFTGRGIRVWGARTISSDPEWKYVNVRRLFLFLERSIDLGTQWVVFEPNNESLWQRVVETVTSFLTGVWKTGALMGTRPEDAFFVRCDRSTMTQDDIDNGRLICEVGVAPTMPAEFVIFRIGQFTASASDN